MFNYVPSLTGRWFFVYGFMFRFYIVGSSLVENGAAAGNDRAELPKASGNVTT